MHLVTRDVARAWLHPLSKLIDDRDDLDDPEAVPDAAARRILAERLSVFQRRSRSRPHTSRCQGGT